MKWKIMASFAKDGAMTLIIYQRKLFLVLWTRENLQILFKYCICYLLASHAVLITEYIIRICIFAPTVNS